MAQLIGGVGISHTPSMGVEFDRAAGGGWQPPWRAWFEALQPVRTWLAEMAPDRMVVVYNDHLNHFDFGALPTLAIGVGEVFPQADEGFGLRPFPDLPGDAELGIHLTNALVGDGFDLTVCHELSIDHGIYSWFPYLMSPPWPTPVVPIAVNMVRAPLPTHQRLASLGRAIGDAIAELPDDSRVMVVATGGMSHQISGARFGIANQALDSWFLDHLERDVELLIDTPTEEYQRLGGTEAAELSLWFAMRCALAADASLVYRYNTVPAITGCGVATFEQPGVSTEVEWQPAGSGRL